MATKTEHRIDVEIRRPRAIGLRSRPAAALMRLAAWAIGTARVEAGGGAEGRLDPRNCYDCGRPGHLHRAEGRLLCWDCFDGLIVARGELGHAEGRLDPRNCYDCGRPLGANEARGRCSGRPYHPACLGRPRGED